MDTRVAPRTRRGWPRVTGASVEWLAAIVLGVLLLKRLLAYGPYDDEEAALGIFATQIHYNALLRGQWLFWLGDLGFGTPLPIGQRLDFHPVFAVGNLISLRVALSAVWVTHVVLMIVYFLRLSAATGIGLPLRIVLLAAYLFSMVTVALLYVTDWVSCVVAWSLYPALVFYLRQAIMGGAAAHFWVTTVRLGAIAAFWVVNSHPGYLAPLAISLGVYALVACRDRMALASLGGAFALASLASAERIYFLVTEMRLFPPRDRVVQAGFEARDYWTANLVPLTEVTTDLRDPFVGIALGAAALFSAVWLPDLRNRHVRGCTAAFLAAAALSVAPAAAISWSGASGAWLFRDPTVFFALLAGGLVLQRMWSRGGWVRMVTVVLVIVQALQQTTVARVGLREYDDHRERLQFYRHQGRAVGLGRSLVDHAKQHGPRVYLSPEAQSLARGSLSRYGVHVVTDLVFLGLNPINAWFKNVSMDRLYPSPALMHGYIVGERDTVRNGALLDVLGVNLIVTTAGEFAALEGLVPVERMPVHTEVGDNELMVLANPDAWPHGVLLPITARDVALPWRPDCPNSAALCRDYATLATMRLPDPVELTRDSGRMSMRFHPADRPRLLFVSSLYRPEWRATSDGRALNIEPIAGAFLGITIPSGVEDVQLAFVPRTRVALAWASSLSMIGLIGTFAVMTYRRRRQR